MLSEPGEALIPGSGRHDKPGIIHCGVTRDGLIALGDAARETDAGRDILSECGGIVAPRKGSEYTFSRLS